MNSSMFCHLLLGCVCSICTALSSWLFIGQRVHNQSGGCSVFSKTSSRTSLEQHGRTKHGPWSVVVSVLGAMGLQGIFVGLVAWLLLLKSSSQAIPRALQEDGTDSSSSSCVMSGDGALDPETPSERGQSVFQSRVSAAELEFEGSTDVCQEANGDVLSDGSPLLMAKFHKTLPHDSLGQVDADAYAALQDCIFSSDFDTCEAVPQGTPDGFLANPLGGAPIDMVGPASAALTVPPMFDFDSPEMAAQMAECYWMALTRDVPFSQYDTNELTVAAAADLESLPGFKDSDIAVNPNGRIDPFKQLFRTSFDGVDRGPMISQLLLKTFTIDAIEVDPMMTTTAAGVDYISDYDSWLLIQNGGSLSFSEELDPVKRYIRSGRDLATLVFRDVINTEAYRSALVLLQNGGIAGPGFIGPYTASARQRGFVQFGVSQLMRLVGALEGSNRMSWYQKWRVHLMVRPEGMGGVVHNTLTGALSSNIHESLLNNTNLMDRVYAANAAQNDGEGTYLLSQASVRGSPTHPSYPAGHAVQNGAHATLLKAFAGENAQRCFPNPVVPDDDGLELLSYQPLRRETCINEDGDEVRGLSFEGEINKMASNVAMGRSIMGVHYRYDSTEGIILGETYAIRLLHQELMSFPEEFDLEINLFRRNTIKLFHTGGFSIDGKVCEGEVYRGVEYC